MSEENNLKEEPKFSSQQFLLSHIDDIMGSIQPVYNNIYQLDTTTKSLPEILALLNGKSDSIPFTKLETHQNAALIPKIRLYRVEPSTKGDQEVELEYIFNKDSKFNYVNDNILGGNYIKGNNSGIKSFSWVFAGTNPVTAQNCIEASIELFFDSLNAFSGGSYDDMLEMWKQAPENPNAFKTISIFDDYKRLETVNYWALVYHPAFKKNRDGYDSVYYRTKVVVGWNDVEPSIKNELFKHPKFANIQDDIEDMNISMYLNLVNHNFSFNEDGTITLKLDYKGSLENSLFSAKNNLFVDNFGFTLKEAIERLKSTSVGNVILGSADQGITAARFFGVAGITFANQGVSERANLSYNQQNSRLKMLSYLRDNKDLNKLQSELSTCGVVSSPDLFKELQPLLANPETLKGVIEGEKKMLDVIEENIQAAEITIKNQYYSRLTKELFVNDNKLYKLSLNAAQVKEWIEWKKTQAITEVPQIQINKDTALPSDIDDITKNIDKIKTFTSLIVGNKPDKYSDLTNEYKEKEETIEAKVIYFTTVGHLLDIAYEIAIKKNLNNKDNTYNKIILSNFADHELDSSQPKPSLILKSIANIPVDLNLYLNHMIEEVYKPLKDTYTFYKFLKDIIIKIVEPALNQQDANDNNINKYANTSLATTILSLQSGPKSTKDPLDQFSNNEQKTIDLKGQTRNTFKPYLIKGKLEKGSKYYNYYFIYDKYLKDFKGVGEQLEDERRGIYHYTVAQSYGLIKSITFKKVDQPYSREAKSVGKKTMFLGQFRDIYAADIKMVGNNIYNNGMLLFLKPSVEFGNPVSSNPSNPTFSQLTGVGGYYSVIKVENSITDNGYETNLTCLFHSNDGFAPEGNKGCSQEELQKAGLIQENGKVNPDLQEVISLLKEEDKKTEQKKEQEVKNDTTGDAFAGSGGGA
jgi:hypothetical protein